MRETEAEKESRSVGRQTDGNQTIRQTGRMHEAYRGRKTETDT